MKRTLCTCALLVFAVMSAGCSFKIFEDVGSDPHPPTVEIIGIAIYVAPVEPEAPPPESSPDRAAAPAQARPITLGSGGITLAAGQLFQIGMTYADAGGDIVQFHLRDRDGSLNIACVPKDQTYFSGTSGAVICIADGYELTGILGRHRLELWAEDSHLSRSEKLEFVITLTP